MDRSKTRVRKTKKGRSGGLLNNLQSEGRERRRRRAEDVGVVLGEAARVRDVGLLDDDAFCSRRCVLICSDIFSAGDLLVRSRP